MCKSHIFRSASIATITRRLGSKPVPDSKDIDKENFLYTTGRYRGEFTPARLAFNANLQEFAQRVSLLCGLETGGKISPHETYGEIKKLWHDLRESKRSLLDQDDPPRPDLPPEDAS